ncbi:MAG: hypothetical protein JXQ96_01830 [Cyclobacteriaceae bacterium]
MKILILKEYHDRIEAFIDTLDLKEYQKKKRLQKHLWFIHLLTKKQLQRDLQLGSWCSISSETLKSMFGDRYYMEIQNNLMDLDIIEKNEIYSAGRFTKSFRFKSRLSPVYSEVIIYEITDQAFIYKLQRLNRIYDQRPFIKEYFKNVISNYTIDDTAIQTLILAQQKRSLMSEVLLRDFANICDLYHDHLFISSDEYGRVYHNFNLLKKLKRKYIIHKTSKEKIKLIEVDISSCQPFLFSSWMVNDFLNSGQPVPQDLDEYHKMTMSADFYSELHSFVYSEIPQTKLSNEKRDHFKDLILKIYNRKEELNINDKYSDTSLYKELLKLFPTVYQKLNEFNKEDKSNVHRITTSLETKVMIDFLIPMINKDNIQAFVIHDGVLVEDPMKGKIKRLIENGCLLHIKHIPNIKYKYISKQE